MALNAYVVPKIWALTNSAMLNFFYTQLVGNAVWVFVFCLECRKADLLAADCAQLCTIIEADLSRTCVYNTLIQNRAANLWQSFLWISSPASCWLVPGSSPELGEVLRGSVGSRSAGGLEERRRVQA